METGAGPLFGPQDGKSTLAVGMITCSRADHDVHAAIERLRGGGFDDLLHLFCEPGTPEVRPSPSLVVHNNESRYGVLGNWRHCLTWLYEHSSADYLMVSEDDVAYCRGARAAWEEARYRSDRVGFWSLYTAKRYQSLMGGEQGWMSLNLGRETWGTQAMCFPRSSAQILLDYRPLHEDDQLRGPTDAIVADCFLEAGLPCYYHNPSLTDHLGHISSIGHNWNDLHVGLNFDADFQPGSSIPSGPP